MQRSLVFSIALVLRSLVFSIALVLCVKGKKETGRHSYAYLEVNDKDEWKLFSNSCLILRREQLDTEEIFQFKNQE
jgi:hypothetical protein